MTTRRIVCLANSRKPGGRCVAGLTWEEGTDPAAWIRPIGHAESEALTPQERCYRDGSEPQLLDVIDVELLKRAPRPHQPENWLVDRDQWWDKTGQLRPEDLFELVDDVRPLWSLGYSSRQHEHNRVPVGASVEGSLRLIYVEHVVLRAFREPDDLGQGRVRVQARFVHDEERYVLPVTDPAIEHEHTTEGAVRAGPAFLTVSLGEPFEGYYYKLVAGLVPLP